MDGWWNYILSVYKKRNIYIYILLPSLIFSNLLHLSHPRSRSHSHSRLQQHQPDPLWAHLLALPVIYVVVEIAVAGSFTLHSLNKYAIQSGEGCGSILPNFRSLMNCWFSCRSKQLNTSIPIYPGKNKKNNSNNNNNNNNNNNDNNKSRHLLGDDECVVEEGGEREGGCHVIEGVACHQRLVRLVSDDCWGKNLQEGECESIDWKKWKLYIYLRKRRWNRWFFLWSLPQSYIQLLQLEE